MLWRLWLATTTPTVATTILTTTTATSTAIPCLSLLIEISLAALVIQRFSYLPQPAAEGGANIFRFGHSESGKEQSLLRSSKLNVKCYYQ